MNKLYNHRDFKNYQRMVNQILVYSTSIEFQEEQYALGFVYFLEDDIWLKGRRLDFVKTVM
jgi:hypothetical protein